MGQDTARDTNRFETGLLPGKAVEDGLTLVPQHPHGKPRGSGDPLLHPGPNPAAAVILQSEALDGTAVSSPSPLHGAAFLVTMLTSRTPVAGSPVAAPSLTSQLLHLHQGVLGWGTLQELLGQPAAARLQEPGGYSGSHEAWARRRMPWASCSPSLCRNQLSGPQGPCQLAPNTGSPM